MDERDLLAATFEERRRHLHSVAFRILGSTNEADDAVQESWVRFSRSDTSSVDNLDGWLTTVVSRVCLDMLRSRTSRREDPLDVHQLDAIPDREVGDPEERALLADSVGLALLVVLDTLTPNERLAFVLHDLFAVPFDEIAVIIDRSPTATRQIASRARRRVQGATPSSGDDLARKRRVVEAFLAASREGDFAALLALLNPEVVLRADDAAVRFGATGLVRGRKEVAKTFSGRAKAAQLALVDGAPAAVWAPGGQPRVVFTFAIQSGSIISVELLADPEHLAALEISLLDA